MILTPWPQSTRLPEIKPWLYVTSSRSIIEGLFGIISKLLKKYFSSTELKKSEAIEGWYKLLPTPQTDSQNIPITYAKKSKTYDIETEFNYGSAVSITDYKDWLSTGIYGHFKNTLVHDHPDSESIFLRPSTFASQ